MRVVVSKWVVVVLLLLVGSSSSSRILATILYAIKGVPHWHFHLADWPFSYLITQQYSLGSRPQNIFLSTCINPQLLSSVYVVVPMDSCRIVKNSRWKSLVFVNLIRSGLGIFFDSRILVPFFSLKAKQAIWRQVENGLHFSYYHPPRHICWTQCCRIKSSC